MVPQIAPGPQIAPFRGAASALRLARILRDETQAGYRTRRRRPVRIQRLTPANIEIGGVVTLLLTRPSPTLGAVTKEADVGRGPAEAGYELRERLASELLKPAVIGLAPIRHGDEQGPSR